MYIDTHSSETMIRSVCTLTGLTELQLHNLITSFSADEDSVELWVDSLNSYPDEVLFYHLSRRLPHANETGQNICTLLTGNNSLSDFLLDKGLRFEFRNNRIELFYYDRFCDFDAPSAKEQAQIEIGRSIWPNYVPSDLPNIDDEDWNQINYLKRRLGWFSDVEADFCLNGFLLADRLRDNQYYNLLKRGPELVCRLSEYLHRPDIIDDYCASGTYYRYEYLLPIERVLIDEADSLSLLEKQRAIVTSIMTRLISTASTLPLYQHDNDNPILRLRDQDAAEEACFFGKVEI